MATVNSVPTTASGAVQAARAARTRRLLEGAIALVFPLKMLMQHMAASGMGGAVTSAIARALGAGRRDHANALVVHVLVIAGAVSALFSIVMLIWGSDI